MESKGAIVEDLSVSLVRGLPLADEPGLGALTFPGYLREVTERYADREALVMYRGEVAERWSYQDLWDRSLEVAKALIAAGVTRGTRVGILMTNRAEYLSALFGTTMAGGVPVILSTFSTPAELEYLLGVSAVSILLYEDRVLNKDFTAMIAALEPQILTAAAGAITSEKFAFLKRLVSLEGITARAEPELDPASVAAIDSWHDFLRGGEGVSEAIVAARAAMVHPYDDGGLFFSSGTTSLPKGILHSQRSFCIQFWRWPRVWGIKEPARSWTGNGFFWSGPMTIMVGTAFSTGGTLVLQPLFDADQALRLISAEKVTLMNGRPHQWARIQSSPEWDRVDLSSLRQVTKGDIILQHPTVDTDWEMPNAFGTTETMTILASFELGDPENADPANFGPVLPGNRLKIVDPQSGALVPVGERGEVCIKGPTLMKGYIGKSPEEILDEDGYYHTGDGGYVDRHGHLFWEGRLNDIIKTGGANVSPEEVDTVIARIPGVKRTQTVGVPHDTLSEMVVACIVPLEGAALDENTLDEATVIAELKKQLASYKVPRRVLFFDEQDFALTGNEKVKAGELREKAAKRLAGKT